MCGRRRWHGPQGRDTAHELIAICDECKHAVADGEGSLWVDMAEVDQHAVNVRAWKQLEAEPATDRLQT